jgi:hypothetical protein
MTGDNMRQVFEAMLPQEELKCPYAQFERWFDEPLERLLETLVDRPPRSLTRFKQVDAEPPFAVITLLHASLIASIIAALLAYTHNVKARPQQTGEPWTKAPLHRRRLTLRFSVSYQFIALAFGLKGSEWRWEKMAELLTDAGRDGPPERCHHP